MVACLREIGVWMPTIRLKAALCAVKARNDHAAVGFDLQAIVPAVGPEPAAAERSLFVAGDDRRGEDSTERDRQPRRRHEHVRGVGEGGYRVEADGLLDLEAPKVADIKDAQSQVSEVLGVV